MSRNMLKTGDKVRVYLYNLKEKRYKIKSAIITAYKKGSIHCSVRIDGEDHDVAVFVNQIA